MVMHWQSSTTQNAVLLQAAAVSDADQNGVGSDQVHLHMGEQHNAAKQSAQNSQPAVASHTLSDAQEAQLNKKAKCCACTIM